jgi:hypothetical protein
MTAINATQELTCSWESFLLPLLSLARADILTQLRSLIFSFDALSTVLIYVVPKLFACTSQLDRDSVIISGFMNSQAASGGELRSIPVFGSGLSRNSEESGDEPMTLEVAGLKALLAKKEREIRDLQAFTQSRDGSTVVAIQDLPAVLNDRSDEALPAS